MFPPIFSSRESVRCWLASASSATVEASSAGSFASIRARPCSPAVREDWRSAGQSDGKPAALCSASQQREGRSAQPTWWGACQFAGPGRHRAQGSWPQGSRSCGGGSGRQKALNGLLGCHSCAGGPTAACVSIRRLSRHLVPPCHPARCQGPPALCAPDRGPLTGVQSRGQAVYLAVVAINAANRFDFSQIARR